MKREAIRLWDEAVRKWRQWRASGDKHDLNASVAESARAHRAIRAISPRRQHPDLWLVSPALEAIGGVGRDRAGEVPPMLTAAARERRARARRARANGRGDDD